MRISINKFRLIIVVCLSLYTITIAIIYLRFPDKSKWLQKVMKTPTHLHEVRVLFDDEDDEMYEYVNKDENNDSHEIYAEKRETTFTKIGEIYFFSAYYDNRPNIKPKLRIITLKRSNSTQNIGCAFKYQNYWIRVYADKYEMCENHGRFYGGWMYFCDVPDQFRDISILSTSDIRLFNTNNLNELFPINITSKTYTNHDKWKSNLFGKLMDTIGICVPPLFGEINLSMLLQFIELGKLQGITHFTFYLYQVKESIRKILNDYEQKGEVTLIEWILPPDISSREIWYNGQILSIQDCLYRNMARTQFLGFIDLDEFIIPVEFFKLTDLINSYENKISNFSDISALSFHSAFFDPKQLPDPAQQLRVLQLLNRNSKLSKVRTKLLTQPQNVFEVGIHHVSKPVMDLNRVIPINPNIAKIHHYRACIINFDPDMTCFRDVKDDAILKYSEHLIKNYQDAVKKTLHLFVPQTELHKHPQE